MQKTDAISTIDMDALVSFDAVIPCEGVRYVHPNGEPFQEPCDNPAEWTRSGHCSKDACYCSPHKEEVTSLSRHGWVKCLECGTTVFPRQLNWIRL